MTILDPTSTLLITGGTGSFGNAVLKRFLDTDIAEIRIFSRDEKKQDDMRKRYNSAKLKFYIGDVRDARSIEQAMRGVWTMCSTPRRSSRCRRANFTPCRRCVPTSSAPKTSLKRRSMLG